ncbi:ATP-binding cassette subfamily B protein [Lewinella marina]|uniref:ABC transporter ATP-binding protein n=1 Tax=Neolewinella marina TaxID=438751 RepID=A0A2G0CFU7_9BACT|nr:peptidase domain-containing ABC transporter [Neolewinella marina]NJB85461.1 ATP-binding cassette subfamily B protein [Neolewinella marina]PHK98849.1 ABC transporter ATP-binding protein [Neolewinella marina]
MLGFTYYQQFEEMDCGAACLRMVARAHGQEYGLEELRERTRISREGVSLLGISEGAESIGLQTLALPASLQQMEDEIPTPCILPWKGDHFVVLYGVKDGRFSIADPDPSVGKTELDRVAFVAGWSHGVNDNNEYVGNVLVLEPTPAFRQRQPVGNDESSIRYVLQYVLNYSKLLTNLGGGLLLALLLQLAMPFLLKSMVDFGIVLNDPHFIVLVVVAQAVLLFTMILLGALRQYILTHIGGRVDVSLVSDYISKLTRLPMEFFDSRSRGDIFQRLSDHERLQDFMTGTTLLRVFNLLNFLVFAVVLAIWNLTIFAIFLFGTLINFLWVGYLQRHRRELDFRYFEQSARNKEQLMEIIEGIEEIKQNDAARHKRWAWERRRAGLYQTRLKLNKLDQYQRTAGNLIDTVKNLSITLVAALAVVDGSLTIGALVAIHYIVAQLNSPIEDLSEFFRGYQESAISLERMNEIYNKEDEHSGDGHRLSVIPGEGHLALRDVSFRYNSPGAATVLHQVNADIPAGKITAIVGASGSGKSTLLKLLIGFYQPLEGEVLLDGTKLSSIDPAFWRKNLGVVSQDGYIFSDTVARNIVMGEGVIDEHRLLRAVKIAQAERFIERLPEGYHTRIGASGASLSKGEQQRILIARAIYHQPPFVFLDEPTSGLDAFTEVTIMDNLFEYLRGSTVVIVAHRYATFEQADHIIVVEDGKVVERGSHSDLMAGRNSYYRLVKNQTLLGS